jgi:hypothetical protein
MFQLDPWNDPQEFKPNPFLKRGTVVQQNIKQVWFAGVHADIGGGYQENESGLSKYPLNWMIEEAKAHGLKVNVGMQNHLVLGRPRKGSRQNYAAPDPCAPFHDSLTAGWQVLEWLPKKTSTRGWYLPMGEARTIPEDALIHYSVFQRKTGLAGYQPPSLPSSHRVEN